MSSIRTVWPHIGLAMPIVVLIALISAAAEPAEESSKRSNSIPRVITRPEISVENPTPKLLTREYCSACHSFQLVEKQRLNRATWEWVMEDMIIKFGAGWITQEEQIVIIEYLVQHYGPDET